MKFWEYSKDEREQWRQQEVTQAFLEELREQDDLLVTESLNASLADRAHGATVAAAKLEGIVMAIRIASEEEES